MEFLRNNVMAAYGAVFIAMLGHASSEFIAVLSGVGGAEVSVWRYLVGASGLLVAALLLPGCRDLITPLRRHGPRLAALSVLGVTVPMIAFHVALDYATVIQVATLVTTGPIWIALANLVINKVPVTTPKIISAIAAVIGVVLLVTDGYVAQLAGDPRSLIGVGLALICTSFSAAFIILVRPIINEYGAIRISTLTIAMGAAAMWLVVGLGWGVWVNPTTLFDRPPQAAWSLLTIGLWNTTIGMLVWYAGLSAVPDVTRGMYIFFLKPVVAAALALAILAQPVTAFQIFAILVICGSVLVELFWSRLAGLFRGSAL